MCFVHPSYARLDDRSIAPWFSTYKWKRGRLTLSLLNRDLIHMSCLATFVISTYSTSVEERVTFIWCLDSHKTILSARKVQYPIVDL